jgi:hypothetical protein
VCSLPRFGIVNREVTFGAIAVIVPPSHPMTFKTAFGRIEDATQHLTELNKLYLSTIETLAMAIDAKDQITHGHIRRVQHYAIGLAKALGVDDDAQIRAIEAAALLHDMGKRSWKAFSQAWNSHRQSLTNEVSACRVDILSAIDFPYPCTNLRHHHENGTARVSRCAG